MCGGTKNIKVAPRSMRILSALLLSACLVEVSSAADLRQVVQEAVSTNPDILESAANRRARDYEYRRSQGAFLPTLDLSAELGPERLDRPNSFSADENDKWRFSKEFTVTVQQLLFDGFTSVNQVYRQSARVDGAALRVMERSEATALDAVESYIDVLRNTAILAKARLNVDKHRRIYSDVRQRFEGGETGAADLAQARERVAAAEVIVSEVQQSLLDTIAKYERVVGKKPASLAPASPAKLPGRSVTQLVDSAVQVHPTVRAAIADADAAKFEYQSTKGNFLPEVALQGQATVGDDVGGIEGRNNEYSGKLVFSWNLYNGGRDTALTQEYSERLTEAQIRVDRVRRELKEGIERSFAAVSTTTSRIKALREQLAANRQVVEGYRQEYDIGQRTLLDVLNAENALFNSEIELISVRAVYAFSTYQLRATSGDLLAYLNVSPPPEAADGQRDSATVLPRNLINLEPLRKF
ncbi:Outer membrane efflux protein BepC precursor [Roseibium album]|uniref:Outer membrane efflux protein BepC n=1 Tax=Roseibium album TaxID=311410 RepID=A0A0M6ZAB9_9HYPH|nr:Outer membrane efflux protein BepC precursor [Roseibium album]CTQ64155.1 Outer membrane efflux protein BepC precursor [Roseibium album]CTQ73869.1 Outer membrane efflux protein BepC precursor [Roseibium album]